MPYQIRLRKRGESAYQTVGEMRFGPTPRHQSRVTVEIGIGVVVGRVSNIVIHRPVAEGAMTVDMVYVDALAM